MKGLKSCIAAFGIIAATSANAAPFLFGTINGSLISYTAVIPSVGTLNGTLDPNPPKITGNLTIDFGPAKPNVYNTSWDLAYTTIDLGGGVKKTIPDAEVLFNGLTSSVAYDPATGHLVVQRAGQFRTRDSFCVGAAAICGPLFMEGNEQTATTWPWMRSSFMGTLDLYINSTLTGFTGTFTEVDTLASGAVITKVYQLTPPAVPIPFTGVLFGSALAALAGVARHRNRRR